MSNLKGKKLFLLDMDGTIYIGDRLFDGAREFIEHVDNIGGRCVFLTNNSSKSVEDYINKLGGMGIAASSEDFVTSVNATAAHLLENYGGKKIYVFGTSSFKNQLKAAGIHVVDVAEDGIDCLVMGFDTELTFRKLEDACVLLGKGVDYIAANPDWVCPTSYGYVPDCGSVSEMLHRATGRMPLFIGKPKPDMVRIAMDKTGFSAAETVLIGDRLYTDIACGNNAGVDTVLVLSGESTARETEEGEHKPTFIFEDISKVLEAIKG